MNDILGIRLSTPDNGDKLELLHRWKCLNGHRYWPIKRETIDLLGLRVVDELT